MLFGVPSKFVYGAVVPFSRGPTSGHVGFLVGEDEQNCVIAGGTQTNAVTVARISKSGDLSARWPKSWPNPNSPPPMLLPGQTTLSVNEA